MAIFFNVQYRAEPGVLDLAGAAAKARSRDPAGSTGSIKTWFKKQTEEGAWVFCHLAIFQTDHPDGEEPEPNLGMVLRMLDEGVRGKRTGKSPAPLAEHYPDLWKDSFSLDHNSVAYLVRHDFIPGETSTHLELLVPARFVEGLDEEEDWESAAWSAPGFNEGARVRIGSPGGEYRRVKGGTVFKGKKVTPPRAHEKAVSIEPLPEKFITSVRGTHQGLHLAFFGNGDALFCANTELYVLSANDLTVRAFDVPKPMQKKKPNATAVNPDTGEVWVGTSRGVYVVDGDKHSWFDKKSGLVATGVMDLALDVHGRPVLAMNGGVSWRTEDGWLNIDGKQLPSKDCQEVRLDTEGNAWIRCFPHGVARISPDGTVVKVGKGEGLSERVSAVCPVSDGLVAACHDRVWHVDHQGNVTPRDSLTVVKLGQDTKRMQLDAAGALVGAHLECIFVMKGGEVARWYNVAKIIGGHVRGAWLGPDGHLWAVGDKAVLALSKEDQKALDDRAPDIVLPNPPY